MMHSSNNVWKFNVDVTHTHTGPNSEWNASDIIYESESQTKTKQEKLIYEEKKPANWLRVCVGSLNKLTAAIDFVFILGKYLRWHTESNW